MSAKWLHWNYISRRTNCGSLPQIRSSRRSDPAVYDKADAPGYDPPVIPKIIPDDLELRPMMTAGMRITNFPRLDKGVQLVLPVLQPHSHVGITPGAPKEVKVIAEPLTLIESCNRAVQSVTALKDDGCVGLRRDWFGHRIEEILLHLADLEGGIECNWEWLGTYHLRGSMERARTPRDGETKGSEQDSHDASIKREEGISVNFPRVPYSCTCSCSCS